MAAVAARAVLLPARPRLWGLTERFLVGGAAGRVSCFPLVWVPPGSGGASPAGPRAADLGRSALPGRGRQRRPPRRRAPRPAPPLEGDPRGTGGPGTLTPAGAGLALVARCA